MNISIARRSQPSALTSTMTWMLTAALMFFLGLVAATGDPLLVAIVLIGFSAIGLLFAPSLLLWFVVAGSVVFAGPIDVYLPGLRAIRWAIVVAALGMGAIAGFMLLVGSRRTARPKVSTEPGFSQVVFWATLFVVVSVISAIHNRGFSLDALVGLKGYFQVWAILIAFVALPLTNKAADRYVRALVWLAFLQIPFALHQYFVLVPIRVTMAGVVPADIVVGTFSGSMVGGGASASLALLQAIAASLVLGYWRLGRIKGTTALVTCLLYLIPVTLAEAKLVLVLGPLAIFVVFRDRILRRPFAAVGTLMLTTVVMLAMFYAFTLLPSSGNGRRLSIDEYWDQAVSYNFGNRGYGNWFLNRTSVYPFWIKHHGGSTKMLIGYGPGATQESKTGLAEHSFAAERFPGYGIGLTGLSGLLWETGLLGTVGALGFLYSAWSLANRNRKATDQESARLAYLAACETGIAAATLMLLHDHMFLFEIGFQATLMLIIGYVIFVARLPADSARS